MEKTQEQKRKQKIEYARTWQKANPEKVREYEKKRSNPATCECGLVVQRWNLRRHRRTPKHAKALQDLQKEMQETAEKESQIIPLKDSPMASFFNW